MRLDHLLAADGLGTPLSEAQRERARQVFRGVGFEETAEGFALDVVFPWATAAWEDGRLRVHVRDGVPAHHVEAIAAALDEVVRAAALVRLDPVRRGLIDPADWARRLDAFRGE